MEWTWLRDWWRLKQLRRPNARHSHENVSNGSAADDEDDDEDICYCDECVNVRHFIRNKIEFNFVFAVLPRL